MTGRAIRVGDVVRYYGYQETPVAGICTSLVDDDHAWLYLFGSLSARAWITQTPSGPGADHGGPEPSPRWEYA